MSFNFNVQGITTVDNTQTGSSTVIDTISPQNIKGLCYWIDGEINTRKGQDRSYKGMQNLVGGDYISKVPSGMQESMNGTPVLEINGVLLAVLALCQILLQPNKQ